MQRRVLIQALGALAGVWASPGAYPHTPYRQWEVYRRKHLLIGCHKDDPQTYALAQNVVNVLSTELPAAKARIARAPSVRRLASLLGTEQLNVAILSYHNAQAMAAGRDAFKPYGQMDLRSLFVHAEYTLVARALMPDRHAWLIAHALHGFVGDGQSSQEKSDGPPPLPWHDGAAQYRKGLAVPLQ